jgi:putative serine protease PepD
VNIDVSRGTRTAPGRGRGAVAALALVTLAPLTACTTTAAPTAREVGCDATAVADKALPSIVTISAAGTSGTVTGSGEVIRSDGYVLTNNHVVSSAANNGSITVLMSDGTAYPAALTGRDALTDMAVLRVQASSLSAIALGASSSVRLGEPVVALGAPLGLSNTVTSGIVSGLDRTVEVPADNGSSAVLLSALQTDAAINPGNSGGALTNCGGQLVGVPTANATVTSASGQTSTGNVGVNFAIPVDLAKAVADELIAHGQVTHSYLGLEVAQLPPSAVQPGESKGGLRVSAVAPGGPAAAAGLQVGDVITEIDGVQASDPNELALLTLKKKPGETVAVTYMRDGTTMKATLTLGTPP